MIPAAIRSVVDEECVYSIDARYRDVGPATSLRGISTEMLGLETVSVAVDLPRHLNRLASSLLKGLGVSAEELLFEHTLFPLHAPFITDARRSATRDAMMEDGHPHFTCGMAASTITATRSLRICRKCMEAGMTATGCCVWLRGLQAAGVLICPLHGCPLWSTNVLPYGLNAAPALIAARVAAITSEESILPEERFHLAGISEDVAWLLGNRQFPGPESMHAIYHGKLRERGYLRADGSVRVHNLSDDLNRHYSPELLARLGTPLTLPQRDNWVERLARRHQHTQAPLRHILFFRFLGLNAEQAISLAQDVTPFGPKTAARPHRHQIQILSANERDAKRASWLSALANQGHEPLRTTHDNLYSWLWRNDREWLLAHRPARVSHSRPRIDWQAWDTALAKQVAGIAARFRAQTEPFARVTKNRIVSATGKAAWFSQPNRNLPNTSDAIAQAAETVEAFALRRLAVVVGRFGSQKLPAWKLRVAAGIGAPLARRPAVLSFLNASASSTNQTVSIS